MNNLCSEYAINKTITKSYVEFNYKQIGERMVFISLLVCEQLTKN